jgi:hypothetical protein
MVSCWVHQMSVTCVPQKTIAISLPPSGSVFSFGEPGGPPLGGPLMATYPIQLVVSSFMIDPRNSPG